MGPEIHAVTGAYGFTGKYIAARLLKAGKTARTLTNSLNREHPFGDKVPAFPLDFDDERELIRSLRGVSVLYNTYWVRFQAAGFSFEQALKNTKTLFSAARQADVGRIVHISITNP